MGMERMRSSIDLQEKFVLAGVEESISATRTDLSSATVEVARLSAALKESDTDRVEKQERVSSLEFQLMELQTNHKEACSRRNCLESDLNGTRTSLMELQGQFALEQSKANSLQIALDVEKEQHRKDIDRLTSQADTMRYTASETEEERKVVCAELALREEEVTELKTKSSKLIDKFMATSERESAACSRACEAESLSEDLESKVIELRAEGEDLGKALQYMEDLCERLVGGRSIDEPHVSCIRRIIVPRLIRFPLSVLQAHA